LVDDFNQAKARQGKVLNKHIQGCLVWLGLVGFLALIWTVSKQTFSSIQCNACLGWLISVCWLIDCLVDLFIEQATKSIEEAVSSIEKKKERQVGEVVDEIERDWLVDSIDCSMHGLSEANGR